MPKSEKVIISHHALQVILFTSFRNSLTNQIRRKNVKLNKINIFLSCCLRKQHQNSGLWQVVASCSDFNVKIAVNRNMAVHQWQHIIDTTVLILLLNHNDTQIMPVLLCVYIYIYIYMAPSILYIDKLDPVREIHLMQLLGLK